MIGSRTTYGERIVENLLKKFPKDECLFFFEPMIVPENGAEKNPDFVLVMRDKGVVIVEVKDWVKLIKGNPKQIHIERRDGEVVPEKNPYKIARSYAIELADKLEKRAELCRRYQGKIKLKFPWMASVALPNIQEKAIRQLEEGSVWTKGTVFGREILSDARTFYDALMNIPVPDGLELKAPLDEVTIEAIRGVIYPEIQVINEHGEDLGTLTIPQEVLMKEEVSSLQPKQMPLMDAEMLSNEATHVATSIQTRLVRGVAGSGKTLVLMHRARYLIDRYPGIKMLVMSFNKDLAAILKKRLPEVDVMHFHKLCSQILGKREQVQAPQNIEGWLQRYAAAEMEQTGLTADYLVDEIAWRKEMEIYDDKTYLHAERKGRGQAVTVEKRKVINTIFQKYLGLQESYNWIDWQDVPPMTLKVLENGHPLAHHYDAILIDEAQDFAPTWIQVVKKLLKPDGYLFVCDDPTQSLFRYYSWKEKGLDIVGRTRILRTPFRCTRQINYAAYSLIANDALLRKNEEVTVPDLNSPDLLEGEKPTLVQCRDIDSEVKHIEKAVQALLNQNIPAGQIAVLCHNRHHVKRWVHLRTKGLYVEHFEKMKGLEFTAVFVPSLHCAFDNAANEEESSIIRRKIFTAMTRARHTLMLTYQYEFPTPLEPLLKYVTQEKVM